MAFYDVFERLCNQRGITPTQVARDNGLTQQTVSHWKTRGSTPKAETVQKLADYFGVSVDYLLGARGKNSQKLALNVGETYFNGAVRVIQSTEEDNISRIVLEVDKDMLSASELVALLEVMEKTSTRSGVSVEGLALLAEAASKALCRTETPPQLVSELQGDKNTTRTSDTQETPSAGKK